MKLRIKGNSLRLRVSKSELARLLEDGYIEDAIQLMAAPDAKLTYTLATAIQSHPLRVQCQSHGIMVTLSKEQANAWASAAEVGVYETLSLGAAGSLDVIVEKDFACLDRSDDENWDTFANPNCPGRV